MTSAEDLPKIDLVMLIDDEQVDQMLYGRIIERSDHADRCISYIDSQDAIDHLVSMADPRPDLILLDINMPAIDGFEFLEEIGRLADPANLPLIVMLTTSFNPEDEVRAMASPLVCAYRNKPLTDDMMAEFRALLATRTSRVA